MINIAAQYGPLGLWTLSLLWMNRQQYRDRQASEKEAKQAFQFHQEQIVARLTDQEHMLKNAISKIDDGIGTMKQKYAEERMYRMNLKE